MAKKRNIKKALVVGQSMAAETLKRRQKAAIARKKALAKSPTLETRSIVSTTKGVSAKKPIAAVSAGVLIAEGDSWFDYPLHDVLSELEDLYGYDVESVAHKGDTVEDMAYADGQLDSFARRVEKTLRAGLKPKAILLSGGGNDVAGDEFALLLNHATSSISGLNQSIVAGVIDERAHDAYVTILSAITALCKAQIGKAIPILIHGYDYPVPDGRGYLGGWGPLPGPWLEPGFRRKGYGPMKDRIPLVVELIDRFNTMLEGIPKSAPFSHVRYVDLRHTLSSGRNYRDWWANELHPTLKGFKAVTAKFAAAI